MQIDCNEREDARGNRVSANSAGKLIRDGKIAF